MTAAAATELARKLAMVALKDIGELCAARARTNHSDGRRHFTYVHVAEPTGGHSHTMRLFP